MSLEYLHPHSAARIIDNSQVYQVGQGNTALFLPFFSSIGPDNVLKEYTSTDELKFWCGEPNLFKYGQALYEAFNWLETGGKLYGLRLLPSTAKYANSMLSIELKGSGAAKQVRVRTENLTAGTASKAALQTVIGTKFDLDADGFTKLPVCIARPKGRGKGYNGLGWKISLMDTLDATYEFRTYALSFTAKDATGFDTIIDGPYTVSFDRAAKSRSRESMYFLNVVNKYSQIIELIDNAENIDTIAEFINPDANPIALDILFGQEAANAETKIHDKCVWLSSSVPAADANYDAKAADLNDVQLLAEGSDGEWTGGDSETSLLVKAYSGLITDEVTDLKMWPIDMVMDANFDTPVKNAINDFVSNIRQDCVGVVDCGFQANVNQTLDYRKNSIGFSSYYTAIFAHDFDVYDEFNGETIKVTSPYFLSKMICPIDNSLGVQWPFVGPRRGTISGFDRINFIPNEQWKESLYKKQVNYVERDPKRTNFATQLTSQTVSSALSQLSNVRALLKIKRQVLEITDDYRMELGTEGTLESMQYNLTNALQMWVANGTCTTLSARVYRSDYDRQQNIARVRIELSFTGIIERIFSDIYINR